VHGLDHDFFHDDRSEAACHERSTDPLERGGCVRASFERENLNHSCGHSQIIEPYEVIPDDAMIVPSRAASGESAESNSDSKCARTMVRSGSDKPAAYQEASSMRRAR
jgi:hypothetical protein